MTCSYRYNNKVRNPASIKLILILINRKNFEQWRYE
jgi:hypothetical protein